MQVGSEQTPLTLTDVLERHGGEIWRERDAASGTSCLRFLLPLGEAAPQSRRRRLPEESQPVLTTSICSSAPGPSGIR